MIIALHAKSFNKEVKPYIDTIFETLAKSNIDILISEELMSLMSKMGISCQENNITIFNHEKGIDSADMLLALGGDGTLLDSITYNEQKEIPMMGINLGRLGFLNRVPKTDIAQALNIIISGNYELENRSLIAVESNQDLGWKHPYALNEMAFLKKDTSSMIVVHTYINGEFLNSYWADGLIVATPTGSTGYSLSCGGPLILPESGNFVITPISPHNLNVRPMVVPDTVQLSFTIESRTPNILLSLDSRSYTLHRNIEISTKKADFNVKLARLKRYSYLETLRKKLFWGLDSRN